jgi:Family of unknown function (DUF6055)
MSGSRRSLLVALICVGAGLSAGPAAAVRPPSGPLTAYPELLTTEHFEIHYTGEIADPANLDRIVQQDAGELAANAERAYSTIVGEWGYPAPLSDGDAKVDIWVQNLNPASTGTVAFVSPDTVGNVSTSWMAVDPSVVTSQHVVAHELLHVLQVGTWIPADGWLLEGAAEWGGFAVDGYAGTDGSIGAPDMSLDCDSDSCGDDGYETGGYSRWPFFQYLSERFGNTFARDVFAKGASLADPLKTGAQLLDATLTDKGTTLPETFNDYTLANVAGSYGAAPLKGLPPTVHSTTLTGTATAALPVQRVAVNHLAGRYLRFQRGAGVSSQCFAATLTLSVALPAGSASKPAFFSSSLGAVGQRLASSGSTASITVPWDTCSGSVDGYLALPNPSSTADSQVFTVSGSLTVDPATVATPATPPDPLYVGPTVPGPGSDVPPSIFLYGAELVRVPAATRVVRLIVFSSGSGKLRAVVAGKALGTAQLRAGNNDIRFKLPASLIRSLRAAANRTLTLTSLSADGAVGTVVTRKVAVVAAPKKPAPKKPAPRR